MTPREASEILGVHSITVTKYCRQGKLRAKRHQLSRCGVEWEILETKDRLRAFAQAQTTRSERATASWARRKRAGFAVGVMASQDDVDAYGLRIQAKDGDGKAQRAVEQTCRLIRWWNALKGDIIGTMSVDERTQYEQQVMAMRPAVGVAPYHPGVG